jgi:radical SAM protein with 4Fe4S-binding SPASM domain
MIELQVIEKNQDDLPLAFIPKTIWIEVASACNLRCRMCGVHAVDGPWRQKPSKLMKKELFFEIVDQTADWEVAYNLHYFGEPLLHPEFIELIKYCRQRAPKSKVSFHTNGYLLTPQFSDRLLESGCHEVFCSLDGVTKETHEEIRIRSNYSRVIKNLEYLLSARNRSGTDLNVGVTFVIQDANRHEQQAFYEHWKNTVDVIHFLAEDTLDHTKNEWFFPIQPERECHSIKNQLVFDTDGTVTVCCADALGKLALGTVASQPLKQLLSSQRAHDLVAQITSKAIDDNPLCRNCTMRGVHLQRNEIMDGHMILTTPHMKRHYLNNRPITLDQKSQVILKGPFQNQGGNAWWISLPKYAAQSDNIENPKRSKLVLLENGRPLWLSHTIHDTIRSLGSGCYSHWQDYLIFSTTDNSDPNTNGHRYEIAFSD